MDCVGGGRVSNYSWCDYVVDEGGLHKCRTEVDDEGIGIVDL